MDAVEGGEATLATVATLGMLATVATVAMLAMVAVLATDGEFGAGAWIGVIAAPLAEIVPARTVIRAAAAAPVCPFTVALIELPAPVTDKVSAVAVTVPTPPIAPPEVNMADPALRAPLM